MNPILFIFSLFLFQVISGFGQTDISAAGRLSTAADSVILISHVSVEEYYDQRDISEYQVGDSAKAVEFPSFFAGEDINPAIIMQRQLLSKQDAVVLANIIRKPVKKSRIGWLPLCFEPHHAILIYTGGHLSYIDLCFHCSNLATSPDIELDNMDFEDGKWKYMKSLFLKHGLTYEMEDTD